MPSQQNCRCFGKGFDGGPGERQNLRLTDAVRPPEDTKSHEGVAPMANMSERAFRAAIRPQVAASEETGVPKSTVTASSRSGAIS